MSLPPRLESFRHNLACMALRQTLQYQIRQNQRPQNNCITVVGLLIADASKFRREKWHTRTRRCRAEGSRNAVRCLAGLRSFASLDLEGVGHALQIAVQKGFLRRQGGGEPW